MEKKGLTKEEIQTLTDLKSKYSQLVNVLGEIEIQKMDLDLRKEQIKSNLISINRSKSILSFKERSSFAIKDLFVSLCSK